MYSNFFSFLVILLDHISPLFPVPSSFPLHCLFSQFSFTDILNKYFLRECTGYCKHAKVSLILKTKSKQTQSCLSPHHPLSTTRFSPLYCPAFWRRVCTLYPHLPSQPPSSNLSGLAFTGPVNCFPKATDFLLVFKCYNNFSTFSCNISQSSCLFFKMSPPPPFHLSLPFPSPFPPSTNWTQ